MNRIYRVLSHMDAPDGIHRVTIEESDGLFRFVAFTFISEVEIGEAHNYWRPICWSGLYRSAEDAERDARAEYPWLRHENSN